MATVEILAPVPASALAKIESMAPEAIFASGAIDPLLDQIEAEVRAHTPDLASDKGRKAIASLAHKVSRTKTFIDDGRIKLVSEEKKRLARIDAEGKRIRERLDALRDEIRRPLTEWEEAEDARTEAHKKALCLIGDCGSLPAVASSADIEQRMKIARGIFHGRKWEEFSRDAMELFQRLSMNLGAMLEAAKQREAEQAELATLRREAAEREERDRREREAREAREREEVAEQERKKREERIAREAREAAEKEAQEREASLQREKEAAEARAKKAEVDRVAAEERAEQARIAAEKRTEEEKARAVEAERQRAVRERQVEEERQRKLEANKRHRAKIHSDAIAALQQFAGLSEDQAKAAVLQVANGKIPHVSITY